MRVIKHKMAGKVELEDRETQVRRENPSFAKLLDILNSSRITDGKSRETSNRLKQVKLHVFIKFIHHLKEKSSC